MSLAALLALIAAAQLFVCLAVLQTLFNTGVINLNKLVCRLVSLGSSRSARMNVCNAHQNARLVIIQPIIAPHAMRQIISVDLPVFKPVQ